MPRPRIWDNLTEGTRKRYIRNAGKTGLTPDQAKAYYESGGKLTAFRGVPQRSISERQWRKLNRLAKDAELKKREEVLDSLLAKGFSQQWIERELRDRKKAIDGLKRGHQEYFKRRWERRNRFADIELYGGY